MLHCNVIMKVTNEEKGIFSFYSHNMNKSFNESYFHYSGLNGSIKKVLIINKSKDTHHKFQ